MSLTPTSSTITRSRTYAAAPLAATLIGNIPLDVNLALYRGDDFDLDVIVTDASGQPFDLTGHTAAAEIRADTVTDEVMATFTCTISTNVVHLHLDDLESAKLAGNGVWDVQITSAGGAGPAGVVTTLAHGTVTITPDVTRPQP